MVLPYLQIICAFLLSSFIVFYAIPIIVRVSVAKHLFDLPNERKVNTKAIPNLGGMAIFVAILISTLLCILKNPFPDFRYIIVGMLMLYFIGIKDDIMDISASKKFIVQFICSMVIVMLGDIRFTDLHGILGIHEIPYIISVSISIFAILSIINAVNLIDGIDGLAAGIGVLASLTFGSEYLLRGETNYAILCFATAGSLTTFFLYNVFGHRNKIFMGDTGSLILGLLLAIFSIKFNEASNNILDPDHHFAPVFSIAVISVPLFDMIRVFMLRIMKGKSPFTPDKNHIHHKLLSLGYTHLKSTILIVLANVLLIALVIAFRSMNNNLLLLQLITAIIILSLLPGLITRSRSSKTSLKMRQPISKTPFNI
jgi:UDP-GlcNAc:undecaprenyl-phosphate GlcNAc-1-phosphate transferase